MKIIHIGNLYESIILCLPDIAIMIVLSYLVLIWDRDPSDRKVLEWIFVTCLH